MTKDKESTFLFIKMEIEKIFSKYLYKPNTISYRTKIEYEVKNFFYSYFSYIEGDISITLEESTPNNMKLVFKDKVTRRELDLYTVVNNYIYHSPLEMRIIFTDQEEE